MKGTTWAVGTALAVAVGLSGVTSRPATATGTGSGALVLDGARGSRTLIPRPHRHQGERHVPGIAGLSDHVLANVVIVTTRPGASIDAIDRANAATTDASDGKLGAYLVSLPVTGSLRDETARLSATAGVASVESDEEVVTPEAQQSSVAFH